MPIEEKNILNRLYFVAGGMFLFSLLIAFKIINIQFVDGEKYRALAKKNTIKNWIIPSSRGNIYADDGSLLATSVPKYEIRFDAVTVAASSFKEHLPALAKALSEMYGKSESYYISRFKNARTNKNRYLLVAKNLGYSDYIKIKNFPLLKMGPYKGGLIVKQHNVREHPIGKVAERLVGNEKKGAPGIYDIGLEGAYNEYLKGKDGKRLKQKIAKGQWKPVFDENEIEPVDGYDVITTINVNIQDIAHHSLLRQLEYYKAEHGCVIVMEVASGEIKAVSNLGRTSKGTYYEKLNYAVGESHEPGSTFKVASLMAALEDQVIDTSTVVDTKRGVKSFYGRKIYDSKKGGYGEISVARALEVSSNIGFATFVDEAYQDHPKMFIDRLKSFNLNDTIGISIKGEGKPLIPGPGHKKWSKNALPSMAYGYNLRLTPLQTLNFYNAIANNGIMVKPRFIKEVRAWNETIVTFDKEITNPKLASKMTISAIQEILKNTMIRGTGKRLYSPNFTMAGKTGTAQTEYWMKDWKDDKRYISSFAGYFPAENPIYSCIVIIHKPSTDKGYYGADVSGPVFKRIAQKIFTVSPQLVEVSNIDEKDVKIVEDYDMYYKKLQRETTIIPNVIGMAGMDAVSLLENIGLNVKLIGNGTVHKQSLKSGSQIKSDKKIILYLS